MTPADALAFADNLRCAQKLIDDVLADPINPDTCGTALNAARQCINNASSIAANARMAAALDAIRAAGF